MTDVTSVPSARYQTPFNTRFRQDLTVAPRGTGGDSFLIRDPVSNATFNFGSEEYFLCQCMDGINSADEIAALFEGKFGKSITGQDLIGFGDYLRSEGLAELVAAPAARVEGRAAGAAGESETAPDEVDDDVAEDPKENEYRHPLFNPEKIFDFLQPFGRALKPLAMLLNILLFAATPFAFYVYFSNLKQINSGLKIFGSDLNFIGSIFFMLFTVNLFRCLVQGTVITSYGLRVRQTGIRREFGMIPHLYISKNGVRHLGRTPKLWIYGTTLLVRLHLFAWGIVCWSFLHQGGGFLPVLCAVFAQAGLGGLLFQIVPHRQTEGQLWMCNYFGWPPKLVLRALDIFLSTIKRQPMPTTITTRQKVAYITFTLALFCLWAFVLVKVVDSISAGLEESFPGIFGRATPFIMLVIVLYFIFTFLPHKFAPVLRKHGSGGKNSAVGMETGEAPPKDSRAKYFILVACLLLLLLPFPHRPGGDIEVLPPYQQTIQAPVSGKVTKVFYPGGDGTLIKSGAQIAIIQSDEVENSILTIQEQIDARMAQLAKQKAKLAELQAGARKEDIQDARAKVEQAMEGVKISGKNLASSKLTADYNKLVLGRLEKLYQQGGYAYLDVEEARKKAEIASVEVEKEERNMASARSVQAQAQAQLDLLLAGAKPEDLEAARQDVQAGEAEVRRLDQQLKYARQQQANTALLMPLDGYLVDSFLQSKVGSYLKVGQNFTTAQTNSKPLIEIKMPEYDTGYIQLGARAEVKLWVRPNDPYTGKVLSMEPSSTETLPGEETRIYRIRIELDATTKEVRPGMTGYGKINAGYSPLGILLLRPMIRFVKIEVWSWLP